MRERVHGWSQHEREKRAISPSFTFPYLYLLSLPSTAERWRTRNAIRIPFTSLFLLFFLPCLSLRIDWKEKGEGKRDRERREGRRWMGWRKGNCKDMTQPIISFPSLFPGFLHLPGHHIPFPFASLLSVGCCHRSYWRGDKGSTQHTNEGNERVREGKEWREVTAGNKWHDFPHPAPFPLPRKGIDRRATRRRRGKRREG